MMRSITLSLFAAGALLGTPLHAGVVVPDASFSFAAPSNDSKDVIELIRSAMTDLGFREIKSTIKETSVFGISFISASYVSVSFIGLPRCVTASIDLVKANSNDTGVKEQAKKIESDLILQLRSKVGDKLLLFQPDRIENQCSRELQEL